MALKFTDDQMSAIKAKGTVLVSAAAGSGKTAVLTERVVKIICDKEQNVGADKLLIVTFTNLAAAELRQKISKKMTEVCLSKAGAEFYLKQKLLLQNAKICSIDAFCIDLVRSNFSVLGLEPDFSVADAHQASKLAEQCLDECLLKYYTAGDKDFDLLGEVYKLDSSELLLKKAVLSIYDYCMTLPQPEKWLDDAVNRYTEDGYSVYVKLFLESLRLDINDLLAYISVVQREVLGVDVSPAMLDGYSYVSDFLKGALTHFDSGSINELSKLFATLEIPSLTVRGCKEADEVKDRIKGFNKKIKDDCKGIISKLGMYADIDGEIATGRLLTAKLTEIVKDYRKSYFEAMSSKKLLTFSMIEHLALELLCTEQDGILVPSKLSEDICKNYRYVLVDEYQDNNDLQDALFFAVSGGGKNLFMVGDVKQCIYGFRNANPDNFLRYKDEFPEYKEENERSKIVLKSNFRSRKGVCDFVNAFCNTVMIKEISGMNYEKEDELDPQADFPEISQPSAELYLISNNKKCKNEEIEADEVAAYIESTVKSCMMIGKEDERRPVSYGDFAILLRSPAKRRRYYEEALKARGIPVRGERDEFISAPEVSSLIALLSAVNNPTRDITLAALMTSPFFGFGFDELAEIKCKNGRVGLYACVTAAAESGDEKCKAFLANLSSLKTLAATKPLGRFVREVCSIYPIAAVYGRVSDKNKVIGNLEKLAFLADRCDNSYNAGLDSFLESLVNYTDDSKEAPTDSSDDSVKILSFHKSKGLQFPICIVAATGAEFNQQDLRDKFIFCDKYGIAMDQPSGNEFKSTLAKGVISDYKKGRLIAEEIRIFYVAMTRAEERLVIFGTSRALKKAVEKAASKLYFSSLDTGRASPSSIAQSKSYLEFLLLSVLTQKSGVSLADYAEISGLATLDTAEFKVGIYETAENDCVITEAVPENNTEEASEQRTLPCGDEEIRKALLERFEYKYSFEAECKIPSKMAVTKLVNSEAESFSFTARPQFMSKSGLTPAQRGTAAHKFMQFADYSAAKNDVNGEIERLREWEYLSDEEADSIAPEKVGGFFKSRVFGRIENAVKVFREYKFMVEYPYESGTTIVQGIADCIFEEADGLVILDFKTDNVSDVGMLKERYSSQLEVYRYAVERIFSKKVKECILYSIYKNDYISF